MIVSKTKLDQLYKTYNKKKYVSPDPLQFLYDYPEIKDREIVALIAASLAYGRVAQILKSVNKVLMKTTPSPYEFIMNSNKRTLTKNFEGFKHRFTTDQDLISLLSGMKTVLKRHESLNACFLTHTSPSDRNIIPALQGFVDELNCRGNYLTPSPSRGSACKRLNLFLRWMVRKDAVDPGGWSGIPKSKLIVPLDTHMAKIGQMLYFTEMKSANMKMALEITNSLSQLSPSDPVKYDFPLTRFGIREELSISTLTKSLNA